MIKSKYMISEAKAKDTTSEAKAKAKDLAFKAKDLAFKAKDLAFKAKDLAPKAKDMTSCPRGASRPRPWPRGLHLWLLSRIFLVGYLSCHPISGISALKS